MNDEMLQELDNLLSVYISLMLEKRNELKRLCDEVKVLKFCKKIAEEKKIRT